MSTNITSNTVTEKDYASHLNQDNQIATSSATSDRLFIEMCDRGPMIDDPGNLGKLTGLTTRQNNWYYLESALYSARISVGDFSAPKAQRPMFILKMNHFCPAL
jgi:hypothetical protein